MWYVLRHHVNPEAEVNTWGWGTAPHRMFGGHESVSGDFSSFHVNFTKLLKNWRHGVWRLGCPVIFKNVLMRPFPVWKLTWGKVAS